MTPLISVRDVTFEPTPYGLIITVITDVVCSLTLRMTEKEARIHKQPILRRGLAVTEDIRFCFTVYTDTEQYEFGDTLSHTFYIPAWPPGQTRYFYFWGTVGGITSPSTSSIFSYTFPAAVQPHMETFITKVTPPTKNEQVKSTIGLATPPSKIASVTTIYTAQVT